MKFSSPSRCALLSATACLVLSASPVKATNDMLEREPGFEIINKPPRTDIIGGSSGTRVGEAAFFFTASHFQITVTTDQRSCHLSKVFFGNMPFISPEGMKQKTFTFQIPLQEMENFLCNYEEKYSEIRGEVMSVCTDEGGVEHEHHDFFEKEVKCANKPQSIAIPDMPAINASAYVTRTFHMRIPKCGGSSARIMLPKLVGELQGSEKIGQRSVCSPKGFFDDPYGTYWDVESGRKGCIWVIGEHGVNHLPQRKYTVMRDPHSHVLSQYFHCKESWESLTNREKNGNPFTVSLDEFLEQWVAAVEHRGIAPMKLGCYTPTNMQNSFLKVDNPSKLKSKFDFIGLTERLTTTICVEVIQVTGLVPPSCDCSSKAQSGRQRRLGQKFDEITKLALDEVHVDHGVTHHGGSFEATPEQLAMIDKLTVVDRALYEEAKRLFEEEVTRIESLHHIRLC